MSRCEFETLAPYKDGGPRDIHASYVPDRDEHGRVRGFVAIVEDVTEKIRTMRVIRSADERLMLAADAAGLGDWSVDPAAGEVVLSDRAAMIFGVAPGRHRRTDLQALIDPEDLVSRNAWVAEALRTHKHFAIEYRIVRPDGSRRWVSGRGRGVYSDAGELTGIAGVVQDITAGKETELALQKSRETAETANRLKDEFLATVSHELRTPLNAIMGWARMLRMGALDPSQRVRAIETIERNAVIQQRIIEDILDVSRIITGKLRLDMSPIDLAPSVHAAIESVRPSAVAKGVTLHAMLDAGIPPVMGDGSRTQQIVWNLLSNAIKFTPRGGSVTVTLRRSDGAAEIVVADTGRGIPAEFLPHVFDRFRQGDASTTRLHGGLGLGLAIVRHLTELHGGAVEARSDGPDRGASFVIRIPLTEPLVTPLSLGSRRAEAADENIGDPLRLNGVRILVVDDELDVRDLVGTVFRRSGAEVRTAVSSREALALVESWAPAVVVCDIAMPAEDGYTFIKELRSRPPERGGATPAAALTAYARPEDRERALAAGYQVHIVKPADPVELARAVERLVKPAVG